LKIEVKKAFFHWGIIPPFYNLSKSFLYLITNKLRVFQPILEVLFMGAMRLSKNKANASLIH
jgi:hypothetical protein